MIFGASDDMLHQLNFFWSWNSFKQAHKHLKKSTNFLELDMSYPIIAPLPYILFILANGTICWGYRTKVIQGCHKTTPARLGLHR
jgi:hypothetical protein